MFTIAQRNTWLGYVWYAAGEVGASEEFQNGLVDWLAGNIAFMGGFLEEDRNSL